MWVTGMLERQWHIDATSCCCEISKRGDIRNNTGFDNERVIINRIFSRETIASESGSSDCWALVHVLFAALLFGF